MDKKKPTIGNVSALLMLVTALVFDGVQFLLDLTVLLLPFSIFLTICATIIFGLWFALAGVAYNKNAGRKLFIMIAMAVTELAPVINAIPAITGGVVAMIAQTRVEDFKEQMKLKMAPQQATSDRRSRMTETRLNQMRAARSATPVGARTGGLARAATTAAKAVPVVRAASVGLEAASALKGRPQPANDNAPAAANDNEAEAARRVA